MIQRRRHAAHRRSPWLRWLLVCTAFSALHGLLGAWIVPAVARGPVAEVCTPNGLQWVALEEDPAGQPPTDWPRGLAQPCVWASAHAVVPLGLGGEGLAGAVAWSLPPGPSPGVLVQSHVPGNAARVLLMSPMRAPPA